MARRLLAFALAFVVTGAPLAGDVCEAACAEHAGHSMGSSAPHSRHHHPESQPSHHHHSDAPPTPASQRAALTPALHLCGHLDAVITESRELMRPQIVNAVVMMARITPLIVRVSPVSQTGSRHGPPTPTRSASPLRI